MAKRQQFVQRPFIQNHNQTLAASGVSKPNHSLRPSLRSSAYYHHRFVTLHWCAPAIALRVACSGPSLSGCSSESLVDHTRRDLWIFRCDFFHVSPALIAGLIDRRGFGSSFLSQGDYQIRKSAAHTKLYSYRDPVTYESMSLLMNTAIYSVLIPLAILPCASST